mmetsp:Transcript_6071/g.13460  ORF Transcript_6071/g.13460 Transcript_6071/m.13460 type:complete len:223 (+) Transcript_6071:380-1048(+)
MPRVDVGQCHPGLLAGLRPRLPLAQRPQRRLPGRGAATHARSRAHLHEHHGLRGEEPLPDRHDARRRGGGVHPEVPGDVLLRHRLRILAVRSGRLLDRCALPQRGRRSGVPAHMVGDLPRLSLRQDHRGGRVLAALLSREEQEHDAATLRRPLDSRRRRSNRWKVKSSDNLAQSVVDHGFPRPGRASLRRWQHLLQLLVWRDRQAQEGPQGQASILGPRWSR